MSLHGGDEGLAVASGATADREDEGSMYEVEGSGDGGRGRALGAAGAAGEGGRGGIEVPQRRMICVRVRVGEHLSLPIIYR